MTKEAMNNPDDRIIQLIWQSFGKQTYNNLDDILDAGKWFLKTFKLDNHQVDKLVDMTKDALQRVLDQQNNWEKIIHQEIGWYSLYKLPNSRTKHVRFTVKNDIINVLFSELLDSPEDIEKINNVNQHMKQIKYRGGKVETTADRVLRN